MAEDGDTAGEPLKKREQTEWTASDARGPLHAAAGDDGAPDPGPDTTPEPPAGGDSEAPIEPELAPSAVPEPNEVHPAASGIEAKRSTPVIPIVVALVVGAIIGAGSAALVYGYSAGNNDSDKVAALSARVEALDRRPDPQPEIDALKSRIAAQKAPSFDAAPLEHKIASLQADVATLQRTAGDRALSSKVAALDGSVEALQARGADVKGLDGKVAALTAAVDGLQKKDATTQAGLSSVQAGQTALRDQQKSLQDGQRSLQAKITSSPALAVVADSLVEAIAAGRPYASQVQALQPLGADAADVAVLKENADKGVPSAQALAQGFAPLADPIVASANRAPANAGLMDRLKSGMASMVTIRSADATAGDGVASRVSRIEADLDHGDVATAYTTWDGLPADAKVKSQAWGALAKTHVEAMSAARALQQQAIAALGRKS